MFVKGALYYRMENAVHAFAPKLRKAGQDLFKNGVALQGQMGH